MKGTYICAQTGLKVEAEALPEGWVISKTAMVNPDAPPGPVPPKHSVIAFSSSKAMDLYLKNNLNKSFK